MYGIGTELSVFLSACLSGGTVVFFYQMLRGFRRILPHGVWAVNAEDFLYWIGVSVYLFCQMYATTYGVIRWYFVLGVVVGIFLAKTAILRALKGFLKLQKRLEKIQETK